MATWDYGTTGEVLVCSLAPYLPGFFFVPVEGFNFLKKEKRRKREDSGRKKGKEEEGRGEGKQGGAYLAPS